MKHTRYIDIQDLNVKPKLNTIETLIYYSILIITSMVCIIAMGIIGWYLI